MTKRRFIAPLVALFLCIGLVSVGFAAWVITTDSEPSTVDGQFMVYKVENKSIQISTALEDKTVKLAAGTKTAEYNWLTFDSEDTEDLTFSLKITITNWDAIKDGDYTLTFDISAVTLTATGFTNSNYIVLPGAVKATVSKSGDVWGTAVLSPSAVTGVKLATFDSVNGILTVEYTFGWGTTFGGINPINHYNANPYSVDRANAAQTALEALYALDQQEKAYSITVKADID